MPRLIELVTVFLLCNYNFLHELHALVNNKLGSDKSYIIEQNLQDIEHKKQNTYIQADWSKKIPFNGIYIRRKSWKNLNRWPLETFKTKKRGTKEGLKHSRRDEQVSMKRSNSASLLLGLQSKYIRDASSHLSRSDDNKISDELKPRLQRSSKSNSKLEKHFDEEFPHHITELTPPFGRNNEEFNDFLKEASFNHRLFISNYISDGKYGETSNPTYEIKQFGDRINEYKSNDDSHSKKRNIITSDKFNRTKNSFTQDKISTAPNSVEQSQKHVLAKTDLDHRNKENYEKNSTDLVSLGNAKTMSRSNLYPRFHNNATGSKTAMGDSAVNEGIHFNTSKSNYKLENFRPPISVKKNTRIEKLKTNSLKLSQTSENFIGKLENIGTGENILSKEMIKETTKSLTPKHNEFIKTKKQDFFLASNVDTSLGLTSDPQITTFHPPILRNLIYGDKFNYSGWKEVKTTPAIENTKSISNLTFRDKIGDPGDNLNQKFNTEPVIQNDLEMPLTHSVNEESPGVDIPKMNKLNSKQYVEAFKENAKVDQLQESENNDHGKVDYADNNPSSKNEALQSEIHPSPNDIFYDEKQAFGEPKQNDWINGYQNQNAVYEYDYLSSNILSSPYLIQTVSPNTQNKVPNVSSMAKILRKKQYRTQQFLTKSKSIIKTAAVLLLPFSALALFTG